MSRFGDPETKSLVSGFALPFSGPWPIKTAAGYSGASLLGVLMCSTEIKHASWVWPDGGGDMPSHIHIIFSHIQPLEDAKRIAGALTEVVDALLAN